jgi:hypothetical protein
MAPIGHLKLACGQSGREQALCNYMEPDKFAAVDISQSRADAPSDLRELARHVATFRKPSNAQGAFELAVSAVPLVVLWLLMLFACADAAPVGPCGGVPLALVSDPARLRPWCVLQGPARKRLGRQVHRGCDTQPI